MRGCVSSAQNVYVHVLWYNALSVTCKAHSCILYAVIMKGIGWNFKVFCMHGCIHRIQIYPDQYVNKIHLTDICWNKAWFISHLTVETDSNTMFKVCILLSFWLLVVTSSYVWLAGPHIVRIALFVLKQNCTIRAQAYQQHVML